MIGGQHHGDLERVGDDGEVIAFHRHTPGKFAGWWHRLRYQYVAG